jgi:hypothetical protein
LLIKLRFTVGTLDVGDQSRINEGFISDNYGFRCDLRFFIDFLRSEVCARAIQAGQRVIDRIAAETNPKRASGKAPKANDEAGEKKKKRDPDQSPPASPSDRESSKWEKVDEKPIDHSKKKKKAKTGALGLKGGKNKKE